MKSSLALITTIGFATALTLAAVSCTNNQNENHSRYRTYYRGLTPPLNNTVIRPISFKSVKIK